MDEFTNNYGLHICYNNDSVIELGIDEAGRGPMFGRVYVAGVVLPKNKVEFNHDHLRDSKKIKSLKKMGNLVTYIKDNAIAWSICYNDENKIDKLNIRQATLNAMHKVVDDLTKQLDTIDLHLLVDGSDFTPHMHIDKSTLHLSPINHTCITGGDNKYTSIAAASILAKYERDQYILKLCEENPTLSEYYGIDTNKGYGTKKHLDGIVKYGITKWHRKSYGICKSY